VEDTEVSAFDIAGAVVWTGLAASGFLMSGKLNWIGQAGFWFGVFASFPAIVCIARLFRGHL